MHLFLFIVKNATGGNITHIPVANVQHKIEIKIIFYFNVIKCLI
jgi:hypothetical protein